MTARKILLATFGMVVFTLAAADARPRPGGSLGGRRFDANKTFGLGLELGAPFGITGKYFLSADRALDFGVGDIYSYFDRSGIHIYADYLFHPVSLVSAEPFELPFYIGIGGRFWSFDDRRANGIVDSASAIGLRVPLGISFDFNSVPLDIFIQVVPVLDFYSGYAAHSVYLDFDASVGIRYWFN
jgi:Protein of unknown function (DUF3996)